MNYEFENKSMLTFIECNDEEKIKIIKAIEEGRCNYFNRRNQTWNKKNSKSIFFHEVYCTLEQPTQKEFPPREVKL